jgi:threonine synthase
MVKQAFVDKELNKKLFLTSANSINIARWLPQQFYYFFAYKQWKEKGNPPVISVPSGNFGNICAGLLANASGLPVEHFIAACNANDVVTRYLDTETYQPKKAIATISNAMDVGEPSNFIRILELFQQQFNNLTTTLSSYSISDEETRATIKKVLADRDYLTDPHGAVAYLALEKYLYSHPQEKGIFLETAHPVKFYDVIEPVINTPVEIPDAVQAILNKEKVSRKTEAEFGALQQILLQL